MIPNLSYIKQLADGSEAFEQKMIGILKKEFPLEKKQYLSTIASQNYTEAAEIVHKIKHKIGMLGMEKAYAKTIQYEEALKSSNMTEHAEFLTILDAIDNYISTL